MNVETGLELTDHSPKWGMVTIINTDGSINRQYVITVEEAEAVHKGNNVLPPGCTQKEWNDGLVMVESRVLHQGQCVKLDDGSLVVNYGVERKPDSIRVSLMKLVPSEWDNFGPLIKVSSLVANQIDVPKEVITKGQINGGRIKQ